MIDLKVAIRYRYTTRYEDRKKEEIASWISGAVAREDAIARSVKNYIVKCVVAIVVAVIYGDRDWRIANELSEWKDTERIKTQ